MLDCQYRDTSARQLQGYNNNGTIDYAWGIDNSRFRTFNGSAWEGSMMADMKRHVFTFENGLQTIDGEEYTTAGVRGTDANSG